MHLFNILYSILAGFLWISCYVVLTYKGFKDKSYGMPLIPLALNVAWEICFSFVFPSKMLSFLNIAWLLADMGLIITYFLYSPPYFKRAYGIERKNWIVLSLLVFIAAFIIMYKAGTFFATLGGYFKNDLYYSGHFIAFLQNLIIAICSLVMLLERKSSEGQSLYAILFRGLGTFMFGVRHSYNNPASILILIIGLIAIIDICYGYLLYKQLKREGKTPWVNIWQ